MKRFNCVVLYTHISTKLFFPLQLHLLLFPLFDTSLREACGISETIKPSRCSVAFGSEIERAGGTNHSEIQTLKLSGRLS